MNSPATLEMISRIRLNDIASGWLRSIADSAAKAGTTSRVKPNGPASSTISAYQLGDAVCHGRFGAGHVSAHWPDGTLLVKFDGQAKSRLVWPSFLDRTGD